MSIVAQKLPKVNDNRIGTQHPDVQREERRRSLSGLVDVSITSREDLPPVAELEFKPGGMVAKRPFTNAAIPPQQKTRGAVTGMSKKSRRRLREKLIAVDWDSILPPNGGKSDRAVCLTLTYPKEYPTDWTVHKAHFKALMMRLSRGFGVAGALWRLEHQRRGAPHYHILVIFHSKIDIGRFRAWASRAWYEVVGSGDEKHLKAGTNVTRLYGPAGRLMRYLSKYLSKSDGVMVGETGRVWGCWGELPQGDVLRVNLSWARWVTFTRRLRRWGRASRYLRTVNANHRGMLIFGSRAQLTQLLRMSGGRDWRSVGVSSD